MPWKEYELYSDEKSGFDVWNIQVCTVLIYKMDNLEPLQCTDNGKWQTGDYWNNCMLRVLSCAKVYQSLPLIAWKTICWDLRLT